MATIEQFQDRVRRAVREALQKCLAEGDLPETEEGEAGFTTIETLALAAGDAISLEVFEQQLAESGMGPPHCPGCGFEGKRIKQRERTVQTRRSGLARNAWRSVMLKPRPTKHCRFPRDEPCLPINRRRRWPACRWTAAGCSSSTARNPNATKTTRSGAR